LLNGKDGVLAGAQLSVEEVLLEPELDKSLEPETNRGEQEVCEVNPEKIKKLSRERNERRREK